MKDKEKRILIILVSALVIVDQIIKIVIYNSKIQVLNSSGWGIGVLNNNKTDKINSITRTSIIHQ